MKPATKRRPRTRGRPTGGAATDTAARLLDCALTLFSEKGYVAATTAEIIAAAGVTKPVLYHHFASKEDLVRQLVGRIYHAGEREWESIIAAHPRCANRLRAMCRASFSDCAQDLRIPRLMFQTYYGPSIPELRDFMDLHTSRRFAQVRRVMQDGLDDNDLHGGDATSLALLFCCITDQHINIVARLVDGATFLTTDRADSLVDAFLNGRGTRETKACTGERHPRGRQS
ncbi:MAG: TetR/AcrR family transcriptional regulator [Planctomycetes bacterium]|nr:TetR/AcrR family transcriptional regulator [Planctomycetota bacterium]